MVYQDKVAELIAYIYNPQKIHWSVTKRIHGSLDLYSLLLSRELYSKSQLDTITAVQLVVGIQKAESPERKQELNSCHHVYVYNIYIKRGRRE